MVWCGTLGLSSCRLELSLPKDGYLMSSEHAWDVRWTHSAPVGSGTLKILVDMMDVAGIVCKI